MPLSVTDSRKQPESDGKSRRKGISILLSTVLLAVGITAAFFYYRNDVVRLATRLGNYGYLAAFLISLITSATVVVPVPGVVLLFPLGAALNPVLVGLVGAAGGIIGEMTGFMVGYGVHEVVQHKNQLYLRMEKWMKRWGGWAVFAFAAAPLPVFDVAGLISGALEYPLWKFLLIGWGGKSIKFVVLVVAGVWGWQALLHLFR